MDRNKPKNPLVNARGRGTESNDNSRYDRQSRSLDLENYGHLDAEDVSLVTTQFFKDTSRTIISENDSPDVPFRYSLNFYRGCEHGCIYCYARPTHEYLGLSAGLDFESKIFVKEDAPELLFEKLMKSSWVPETITMSGVTDCYQPAEKKYQLARRCLEVFLQFKNPVSIITKNQLVTRDLDLLRELAQDQLVNVVISITTLDAELGRVLEPRTSSPQARLRAIQTLSEAGVPVGVNVAPIIPGLTEHEIPEILRLASLAGATRSGYTVLRLPHSVGDLFTEWLERHRPDSKEKVLKFIRELRDGKISESNFGSRMTGQGPRAENIRQVFDLFKNKYGLGEKSFSTRTDLFRRPGDQMNLF